ncbi:MULTISPECIES: GlxA family transcriptional regulator [unclassified Serratia (in: enterobacteria)]|uniref:GlxA family transcriptional regulator n=1 Tax=unclassified Serratia (in: enterobacteria) TaxID=2647522 RepID=UPI0005053FEA|nr:MULTISPECIES: helix-turn-helix domain-containing protein [unclassified Serratia (in: enterobacteria)]KFK97933.1 AraC family transcriptional regulator [Serratia sp. Ag2]KFL00324.1 AraC family transcriptional regulator [Serratia sp. Ag1]
MPAINVAVVAFEHISPFHLAVPGVVFSDAHAGSSPFNVKVCAIQPGCITTAGGYKILVEWGLEALAEADILIIPSWHNLYEALPSSLLAALLAAHQRGAKIVGLCLGAYVLAASGLLDGLKATTHWEYAGDFAQRFPKVMLDAEVLYVEQGNLLTSAGTVAGIDACLYLLRQQAGVGLANHVARRLVIAPHRNGGQAQFITHPIPATAADSRLSDLLAWLRAHLQQEHTLDTLAERAVMSRRSFTRHFRQLTQMTVNQWLQMERLALAQTLLESSEHGIETVANLSGFGSAMSFRHHFRRHFGVSPLAWRQSFTGK